MDVAKWKYGIDHWDDRPLTDDPQDMIEFASIPQGPAPD